ncbi:MAG TPA: hypothetical protein VJL31_03150 [Gemmatimonadales bacterium]|jgi:cytochrome c551/c552|nr:hypothetical protein [Gemmatimonadales bacterium]
MTPAGAVLVVTALLMPQAPSGRAAPNACVTCHERLPATTAGGHSFQDWRASPHGRAGATCDKCHGGNPAAANAEAAHQGVYSSRESRSLVYYTRIPATCGSCHQPELEFFSHSRHYNQLVTTGRGPNCVTCHGSMAIQVLSPGDMENTCSACHNAERGLPSTAPVAARYLLVLLRQVEFGIDVSERLAARTPEPARRDAAVHLRQARETMQRAREGWHSFALGIVEATLLQAAQGARRADSVLAGGARR